MAEENAEQVLEDQISNFLHGPEEELDYEPKENAAVEGEEVEGEEVEVEASEETEEEEKKPDEPQVEEIEFEGTLYEVPVELKDALLRQSDYTQKTQEVAEQRKLTEVRLGELEERKKQFEFIDSVQPDLQKANELKAQAEQYKQYLKAQIDSDSISSVDITKIQMLISDAQDEAQKIAQSVQEKQQEFQKTQEQSVKELLDKGNEVLKARIPKWGKETQEQLKEYALSNGYAEQEVNSMIDPRYVEALWKASQYDSLKEKAAPAVKKVQAAPTIKQRARDPETGQFTRDEKKLQKALKSNTVSNKDKARLVGEDIANRFF